ncbi:hypothetical protein [Pseudomonas sp. NW5]|uniref:hypothetical protein n=1 Tax=Pseudomonas sp. NW5 TaxID=2934934 RepID=UPI002020DB85|nr:hypothetical protein [Pseudomonas sp. NW5]MCL7461187.1 hypothetical protein [Pseudomonas sp. NW5]
MPWLTMATAASALLAAALWFGARRRFESAQQPLWFCALLGFVLSALAAASGLGSSAALLLEQARDYLALPLLAAVALALGRHWQWQGSVWGRVVLGLCLFFEVARQLQALEDYRLLLGLLSVALILYSALCRWPARRALPLGLASALLLGGAVLAPPMSTIALASSALSYPLLALLLVRLCEAPRG